MNFPNLADRSPFPGGLELMVLQTLRRQPLRGLELAHTLQQNFDDTALQRMLRVGWASSDWGVSCRNSRVRIYKIRPRGRKRLERTVSSFQQMLAGLPRAMRVLSHRSN